jgi:tRNA nucleotidyltransferase/poly(A) polymerase
METRLTPDQMRAVNLIQEIARGWGMNLYLTGGAIRDILTGFPIRDLDFTVQGNALKLQKELEKAGGKVDMVDEELRLLHVVLPGNVRAEINMARQEAYDKPGKPPAIEPATINEDLRRRDFTVNAMALSLNTGSLGLLLDPFNGSADIETKSIRVLHNYAFLEEPSRLIRATRFAARFHWELEERTKARYDSAKENNYIEYLGKTAIGYEIEQLAHEEDPINVMRALEREGWLKILHPKWTVAKVDTPELQRLIKVKQQMQDVGMSPDASAAVIHFLTFKLGEKEVHDIQRMIPHKELVNAWKHLDDDAKDLAKKLQGKEANQPSGTWKILSEAKQEALLFLATTVRNTAIEGKIANFFGKWRQMQSKLPFPEMAELRITAQLPEYPQIMQEAFLQIIDGKLRSHGEIMRFLKPYEPPPPPPPPTPAGRRGRKTEAQAKKAAAVPQIAAAAKPEAQPAAVTKPEAKGKAAKAEKPQKLEKAQKPEKPVAKAAANKEPAKVAVKKAAPAKPAAVKKVPAKAAAKKPNKPTAKAVKAPAKKAAPPKAAPPKKAKAKAAKGRR